MLQPYNGRVYDRRWVRRVLCFQRPFYRRARGREAVQRRRAGSAIYQFTARVNDHTEAGGDEYVNRDIGFNFGSKNADTLLDDSQHPNLRADFVMASRGFNMRRGGGTPSWKTTCAGNTAHRRRAMPTLRGCST